MKLSGEIISLIIAGMVIFGAITALIAVEKKRSGIGWFFAGTVSGMIAIIIVAILPKNAKKCPKCAEFSPYGVGKCGYCGYEFFGKQNTIIG